MKCSDVQNNLSRLIDGDVNAQEATKITAHLQTCPECRSEYHAMARIKSLVCSTPIPASGEQLKARVLTRFEQQARTIQRPEKLSGLKVRWQLAALAMSVTAITILSLVLNRPHEDYTTEVIPGDAELAQMQLMHSENSNAAVVDGNLSLHRDALAGAYADWLRASEETR